MILVVDKEILTPWNFLGERRALCFNDLTLGGLLDRHWSPWKVGPISHYLRKGKRLENELIIDL